jgi:hypothetical protein
VSKIPEWAEREAAGLWVSLGFVNDRLNHLPTIALALVAAEKRGIERAAKIADEAAAMRARLFDENGASLNASKAVQAEELAAAIRQLGDRHD